MSRNRYFLLCSFLRARAGIDTLEEEKKADRLWRVCPIMESFCQCCLKVSRAPELSVDEIMIPFQGKMPSRQYFPMKSNPFGMKIFVLANPNSVILDFHAYTGEETFRHLAQQVTDMGIGASAVITLLTMFPLDQAYILIGTLLLKHFLITCWSTTFLELALLSKVVFLGGSHSRKTLQ